MKIKQFLMAAICLISMVFAGCTNNSQLNGTTWKGDVLQTSVIATFSESTCSIALAGYVSGTAVGEYKATKSSLTITIKSTFGAFDGQLSKGDEIKGTYDLSAGDMYITLYLYGQEMAFKLKKV